MRNSQCFPFHGIKDVAGVVGFGVFFWKHCFLPYSCALSQPWLSDSHAVNLHSHSLLLIGLATLE